MEEFGLSPELLELKGQALDADGEEQDRALDVVLQFLSERRERLVLYGGLGLDLMLRRVGARIYPDEERPDFDFYSSRNVDDAYELADILAAAGFKGVDAKRGLHVQTIRVRVGFIPVADISFVPEPVLSAIPRLSYEYPERSGPSAHRGREWPVSVVHPHWQMMDQHLALSFPFRDPPREPVFHRFGKDVKRFNLIQEHYPIEAPPSAALTDEEVVFPVVPGVSALHGRVAFRAFEWALAEAKTAVTGGDAEPSAPGDAQPPTIIDELEGGALVVKCRVPGGGPVLVACTCDADSAIRKMAYEPVKRFRPMMDLMPGAVLAAPPAGTKMADVIICEMPLRLVAATPCVITAHSKEFGARQIPVVSAQYAMLHFLLAYHTRRANMQVALSLLPGDAEFHLGMYTRMLALLKEGCEALETARKSWKGTEDSWNRALASTPFALTVKTVGDLNVGESQLNIIAVEAASIHRPHPDAEVQAHVPSADELKTLPESRYRPGISQRKEFEYGKSEWYSLDGQPADK